MRTVTLRELLKPSTVSAAVIEVDSWFHCTRHIIRIKRVSVSMLFFVWMCNIAVWVCISSSRIYGIEKV